MVGNDEYYFKEIEPYIDEMKRELDALPKNRKVVSKKIGLRKYTLVETKDERNLFVLEGNYRAKKLLSLKK